MPEEYKGGVFATSDMNVIRRALEHYIKYLNEMGESERAPSEEMTRVANLYHRVGRIKG